MRPRKNRGALAAGLAATALLSLLCTSCPASLGDFFTESSSVTSRVQDAGAKPLVPPSPSSVPSGRPISFLIVGDPHFGAPFAAANEVLDSFSALAGSPDANGNPYAFVLYVGDDMHSGAQSEYESFTSWAGSMKDSKGYPMQWYSAVGNHDLYHGGWTWFRQYIGPSFFHLSVGNYSIYVIDTGQGSLGDYQIGRLRAEFAADPSPKIVISHYPIYGGADVLYYYRLSDPREVAELLDLFARSGVRLIVAGHWHYLAHDQIGSMDQWLVESLTVTDGGRAHCFAVTLDGSVASLARISF